VKPLLNFKNLNHLLKKESGKSFKTLRSNNGGGGNSLRKNLKHICLSMEFNIKRLFLIHLNKMGLLKEKIGFSLKWLDVCYILKDYIKKIGLKPFVVLILFQIEFLQKQSCMLTLRKNGMEENPI
jgi:hypothetical protein